MAFWRQLSKSASGSVPLLLNLRPLSSLAITSLDTRRNLIDFE